MALTIGQIAPEFTLPSTSGENFFLRSLLGNPSVIYFYPKDFTSVCTKEACSFRDQFAHLRDLEVPVFGISKDSLDTHRRFKAEYALPFELLTDEGSKVARKYEARVPLLGLPKRITYLLDGDLRIAAIHDEMLGHESHVNEVLEALAKIKK